MTILAATDFSPCSSTATQLAVAHGRSGRPRGVLGSVAEEVARRSSRPVLIVRGFSR